jgi:hypothetical protein
MASTECPISTNITNQFDYNSHRDKEPFPLTPSYLDSPPDLSDTTSPSYLQTPASDVDDREFDLQFFDKDVHHTDKGHEYLINSGDDALVSGGDRDKVKGDDDGSLEDVLDKALLDAITWDNAHLMQEEAAAEEGGDSFVDVIGSGHERIEIEEDGGDDQLVSRSESENEDGNLEYDFDNPHSFTYRRRHRSSVSRQSKRTIGPSPAIRGSATRASSVQTIRPAMHQRAPVIDVYRAGAKDLIEALDSGRATSVQIMEDYLDQIDKYNGVLRAVTHVAPRQEVLRLARACDKQRAFGLVDRKRTPLHGLPVLVK